MSLLLKDRGMARGRKASLTIRITAHERQTLLAWQRTTTIPAGLARRGRMLFLLADGVLISHMAATVGISRRFVYKWVRWFVQEGLADKPGRRHRPVLRPYDLLEQHDVEAG